MPRLTKEEKWAEIHQQAMKRFNSVIAVAWEQRQESLADRRFYSIAGAQWEGALEDQFEQKPMLEINKVHLAIMRIINEFRQNKITVNFVSKDGSVSPGDADLLNGLFRADEQDCLADEAYYNAFEEAVGGGFGAFRLRTVYEDESDPDNEKQRIVFEPIFDADTCVFFDPGSIRQDKSDAQWCFVLVPLSKEDYKDQYGEDPSDFPRDINQSGFDWSTTDNVYVAEYYTFQNTNSVVYTYSDMTGGVKKVKQEEFDEDPELEQKLQDMAYKFESKRTLKVKKVRKYILSGHRVIDDLGIIAGKYIPIIPVYGKRWVVEGVERFMGHVRLAKDAQRLKNMQVSKLADLASKSDTEKPIFTPEQVEGHEQDWADAHIKDLPYMLLNPVVDPATGQNVISGPIAYTKSPSIPESMAALLQLTDSDMADILGNRQDAEKVTSHVSGKALEMYQTSMDMQTFMYVSNFSRSMMYCGRVWKPIAEEIYIEEARPMKTVSANGAVGTTTINQPTINQDGEQASTLDIFKSSFDVAVDVGPSTVSRKEAVVRQIMGMLQFIQDPQQMAILTSFAIMNMEGEGVADIRDYFRKQLVQQGAVKPTPEEAKVLAMPKEPSSSDILAKAAADQATAEASKARAEIAKVLEEIKKIAAQTENVQAQTLQMIGQRGQPAST